MARTYTVGSHNTAARLDDHTGSWVTLTPQGDADTTWRDVMSDPLNPDKVIIVGSSYPQVNGSIQVSTDAGLTWSIPGGTWSGDYYFELWYVDSSIIWAIGAAGKCAISTDGGVTFNDTVADVDAGSSWHTSAIFAIDNLTAVVLGSDVGMITDSKCYVWKTSDGGTTWSLLNGGNSLINTDLLNPVGWSNGIWMSPDETKIVVGTGYTQQLSMDSGVTFTNQAVDMIRSGLHLTWYPTYDANPLYFRHTGGVVYQINQSIDSGIVYSNIRSVALQGAYYIIGAHFYTPFDGYFTDKQFLYHTIDGGVTQTLSYTGPNGIVLQAVWTSVEVPPLPPCYELIDCEGILPSIFTEVDLSGYIGQIIKIVDANGVRLDSCWTVSDTGFNCPTNIILSVYACYDTCEDCLPLPEDPIAPTPRIVDPGYDIGSCSLPIVLKAKCTFGEMMHHKMMQARFGIKYCCPPDELKTIMAFEKINMKLLTGTNPTPDPCNPICSTYGTVIFIGDSAVTTYTDCNGDVQTIITDVAGINQTIGFCALNTIAPSVVITHDDDTTDTYTLEPYDICEPPFIDPRPCIVYEVRVYNPSGDIVYRYEDCNGDEIVVTVPQSTTVFTDNFCAIAGQNIVCEGCVSGDSFVVTTHGECINGLPPCVTYQVIVHAFKGGTFRYVNCQGQDATQVYLGDPNPQVFEVCGIAGQATTLVCSACTYFSVTEIGNC